jgi:hypothetical protein
MIDKQTESHLIEWCEYQFTDHARDVYAVMINFLLRNPEDIEVWCARGWWAVYNQTEVEISDKVY